MMVVANMVKVGQLRHLAKFRERLWWLQFKKANIDFTMKVECVTDPSTTSTSTTTSLVLVYIKGTLLPALDINHDLRNHPIWNPWNSQLSVG